MIRGFRGSRRAGLLILERGIVALHGESGLPELALLFRTEFPLDNAHHALPPDDRGHGKTNFTHSQVTFEQRAHREYASRVVRDMLDDGGRGKRDGVAGIAFLRKDMKAAVFCLLEELIHRKGRRIQRASTGTRLADDRKLAVAVFTEDIGIDILGMHPGGLRDEHPEATAIHQGAGPSTRDGGKPESRSAR